MSVTMYVTSANYICYESPKSGFLDLKTWFFIISANAIKP